jgi:hypothetical protein
MLEFRWLLEELRVSFVPQELRRPQPVSIKRLEKAWGPLGMVFKTLSPLRAEHLPSA